MHLANHIPEDSSRAKELLRKVPTMAHDLIGDREEAS
jgi:hypothetical protein